MFLLKKYYIQAFNGQISLKMLKILFVKIILFARQKTNRLREKSITGVYQVGKNRNKPTNRKTQGKNSLFFKIIVVIFPIVVRSLFRTLLSKINLKEKEKH